MPLLHVPHSPRAGPTASSAVSRACVDAGGTYLPPVVRATKIRLRGKALGGCGTCSRLAGGQNMVVPWKKTPSFSHQYGMPEKRSPVGRDQPYKEAFIGAASRTVTQRGEDKMSENVLGRSVVPDSLGPFGTVAHQAPLSIRFSKQPYWSGLPFPPPGHLPHPEIRPANMHLLCYRQILLPLSHQGSLYEKGV